MNLKQCGLIMEDTRTAGMGDVHEYQEKNEANKVAQEKNELAKLLCAALNLV